MEELLDVGCEMREGVQRYGGRVGGGFKDEAQD